MGIEERVRGIIRDDAAILFGRLDGANLIR
jgi:hypothetical protein